MRILGGMANRYELNYDWSKLGPTEWTDFSVVTLQVDLHSHHRGAAVRSAIDGWWDAMPKDAESEMFPVGEEVAYDGGCRFPTPSASTTATSPRGSSPRARMHSPPSPTTPRNCAASRRRPIPT